MEYCRHSGSRYASLQMNVRDQRTKIGPWFRRKTICVGIDLSMLAVELLTTGPGAKPLGSSLRATALSQAGRLVQEGTRVVREPACPQRTAGSEQQRSELPGLILLLL